MNTDNTYVPKRLRNSAGRRVWLTSSFRVEFIKMGIEKAGSINRLARELGYRSRIHPGWSIRQILVGEQPFPYERLLKMTDFVGYPMDEVLRHRTEPARVTVDNTNAALRANGLWCYHVARMRLR
ncbi:MAG: hypothetical protein MUO87_06460 [Thermoplasmata archaeon]|nr:hypothetical protein [Thermoplasmata archaeon]